jgi:hypothetical protein
LTIIIDVDVEDEDAMTERNKELSHKPAASHPIEAPVPSALPPALPGGASKRDVLFALASAWSSSGRPGSSALRADTRDVEEEALVAVRVASAGRGPQFSRKR